MEIFALDGELGIVTPAIPYFNLQWSRRYHEAGTFEVQVPGGVYDPRWAYIVTHDRTEVGMVQKLAYENDGSRLVTVSGYFAEKMLDRRVTRTRYTADNSRTETTFWDLYGRFGTSLPLAPRENPTPLGDRTQSDFIGEKLGEKLYGILETRGLSYRVRINDFQSAAPKMLLEVWRGVDRTQGQAENPWYVFSTDYGNVEDESVSLDSSGFANVCVISAADESLLLEVDQSEGGERYECFLDKGSSKKADDQTQEEFEEALRQEGREKLADLVKVQDIDATAYDLAGYRRDYDLGDVVTVDLADIGVTLETRIVEVDETFKPEGHEVTLGFGSKRISNIRRAVRR